MRNITVMLIFAALLALPGTAFAGDDAAAQAYFEKGAALYFEGKFAEALVQFKKGYAEAPNATFQYNIAVCNLRLNRYREALAAAQEARKIGGLDQKDTTQNEARIAAIPRVQTTLRVIDDVVASIPEPDVTPEPQPDLVATTPPRKKSVFGPLGWVGVGASAVGGGLLIGALVTELSLQTKWDDYNRAADAGDAERFNELKGEIERGQTTGMILLYSGAGLAAAGVTLIIVDLLSPGEDSSTTAGLFIGPNGTVGGSATLRF